MEHEETISKKSKTENQWIEWAYENPEAIMALCEGRAAVVPLDALDNFTVNLRTGEIIQINDYIKSNRLDKPKEAV